MSGREPQLSAPSAPCSPTRTAERIQQLNSLLADSSQDAILLTRAENISWMLDGADARVLDSYGGLPGGIAVGPGVLAVIVSEEAAPLVREQIRPALPNATILEYCWSTSGLREAFREVAHGNAAFTDCDPDGSSELLAALSRLRRALSEEETDRARYVGRLAAKTLLEIAGRVSPGKTEESIAARCSGHFIAEGFELLQVSVAADERMDRFRSPVPGLRVVKERVQIRVRLRKFGLQIGLCRSVYFAGDLDWWLRRHQMLSAVQQTLASKIQPGIKLGAALSAGAKQLEEHGIPDLWDSAEVGHGVGYAWRDPVAVAGSGESIEERQLFAWAPSMPAATAEDTYLCLSGGAEPITVHSDWPSSVFELGEQTIVTPVPLRR